MTNINIYLNIIVILSQGVTHVALELRNREVQFKLAIFSADKCFEDCIRETADKTALIILHHLVEVVLQEFHLEVGKVEAAIVVGCKLVGHIQDHLVRVALRHECVGHGTADFENLVIGGDQLIELQGRVRVD